MEMVQWRRDESHELRCSTMEEWPPNQRSDRTSLTPAHARLGTPPLLQPNCQRLRRKRNNMGPSTSGSPLQCSILLLLLFMPVRRCIPTVSRSTAWGAVSASRASVVSTPGIPSASGQSERSETQYEGRANSESRTRKTKAMEVLHQLSPELLAHGTTNVDHLPCESHRNNRCRNFIVARTHHNCDRPLPLSLPITSDVLESLVLAVPKGTTITRTEIKRRAAIF